MNKKLPLILRSALWDNPQELEFTVDTELLEILRQQCIETLVAHSLIQNTNNETLKNHFIRLVATTMKQHKKVNMIIKEVNQRYQQIGFKPIILKGQGCAYYYPAPYLRPTGDLDIYFGDALQLERTKNATDKHSYFKKYGIDIELHKYVETLFYPWYNKRFQKMTTQYMSHPRAVILDDVVFHIPPIQFQSLIIFNHIWQHFIRGGIGLRQFIDLAYILHHDYAILNYAQLKTDLERIGLFKAWKIVGCVVVDILGLPLLEYPFYDYKFKRKGIALYNIIIKEGNLGKNNYWGNINDSLIKKKSTAFKLKVKRCYWIFSVSKTEGLNSLVRIGFDFYHFFIHSILS